MLDKLKSRKFLATLMTNIIAIATLFTSYEDTTVQIIALIVLGVANIIYGIVEGTIDAKAVVTEIKETAEQIESKL